MKRNIFYAVLSALFLVAAVSCHRRDMDFDTAPENYYLLTLENQSNTDIVWFIPYHSKGSGSREDELPASLSGTDNCRFLTKAHERAGVNVTEDKSGPFESYAKDALVPFYVFDEVEAALDDSNLSKLLDAIEALKESTQLIVISHQRRTMEQADVLYGVSMQADGVSHVVSQRLDRTTGKVVDA